MPLSQFKLFVFALSPEFLRISPHEFFTAGVFMILQKKFSRFSSRFNVLNEVRGMKL